MAQFFLGQIMMTGFGFAPRGFSQCNGQLLPIQQYNALFALLGIYYGGNGSQNFALPNMQGRTPVGFGTSADGAWQPTPYSLGQIAGTETVTVLQTQLPRHNHVVMATTDSGTAKLPSQNTEIYAQSGTAPNLEPIYGPATGPLVPLAPATLSIQGGSTPHVNMQPYRVINFNIAMQGVFPSRN